MPGRTGRIEIDDVAPVISGGRYLAKAVIGEMVPISATVWREGHDVVAATAVVRYCGSAYPLPEHSSIDHMMHGQNSAENAVLAAAEASKSHTFPMMCGHIPDVFHAEFIPDQEGLWVFQVQGYSDPLATWRHAITTKMAAGQSTSELSNDLLVGAQLMQRAAAGTPHNYRGLLLRAAAALRQSGDPGIRTELALSQETTNLLARYPLRELVTEGRYYGIWVDQPLARCGAWYEIFPRSTGGSDDAGRPLHGTFTTAAAALPRIAAMGFTVVYVPPIHPIGRVHRKGRNNAVTAQPDDVGSPWAIGSVEGGHDAIHPALGTIHDFDDFVAAANDNGMQVALDLALQCAPDHPWATHHRQWFTELPDGTIAYAENPPKKYQDIYPLNFDNDPAGLYNEILRIVRYWISHGVKIFRVDNPHTKPPDFWDWLISTIKNETPHVIFLAEAFTRPARLYGLAKLGFTQSYSYFTWRTSKWDLTEFGQQIVAHADYACPNLFVNTPDILHESLQRGGPGMFAIRAVLAATLGTSWGVYSGYELFEHQPVREGSEEYLNSEKYELRPRDFDSAVQQGRSLEPFLSQLNAIRRAHPALCQMRTLVFHHIDNDALLAYSKYDPITGDSVVVVLTLNAFAAESATLWLNMDALGMNDDDRFWVRDEITGEQYHWGKANYVHIDPAKAVAHILHMPAIAPHQRAVLLHQKGMRCL